MTDTAGPFPSPYELDIISHKKRDEAAERLRLVVNDRMRYEIYTFDRVLDYSFNPQDFRRDAFDVVKKDLESCGWEVEIIPVNNFCIRIKFWAKKNEPENN